MLALRWSDVDLDRAALSFTPALVEGMHGPVLAPTKSGRTYRVELDPATSGMLATHRARTHVTDESYVFAHPDGRPWLPNHVTKRFIAARSNAGLARFRRHGLRHFMATQMHAAGVPIAVVPHRLSHARASTTLNIYAHAVPGGDRSAAHVLAAMSNG